jgi:hypothetical protein
VRSQCLVESGGAKDAVSLHSRASARTKADYRRDLERHVYPYLGALPVDGGITARHVAEWLDALEVSGLAPKTIANIHGLVSSIMSDGMAHRPPVCDHNPFVSRLRESPDVRGEEMVFLTPAEFELIQLIWFCPRVCGGRVVQVAGIEPAEPPVFTGLRRYRPAFSGHACPGRATVDQCVPRICPRVPAAPASEPDLGRRALTQPAR